MVYKDKEVRKAYDRARAAKLYSEFQDRRVALMEKEFENRCFLCEVPAEQRFHLHHIIYVEDYPTHSKTMSVRIKRLEEAELYPERFRLLCPSCHSMLERVKLKSIDLIKLLSICNISTPTP